MNENILEVFGNASSKLPRIFYNCDIISEDKAISQIEKLFLFQDTGLYSVRTISSPFPLHFERVYKRISGYYYVPILVETPKRFDILCIDKNTKLLIKGISIRRSGNSVHSHCKFHSFYARDIEYK